MKTICSKPFRSALFVGAAAIMAFAGTPSFAQTVAKGEYYETNEIVVVPYGIQRERTGRRASGSLAPEETLTLSRVVSTDGLNLRYEADVSALHQRVEVTARDICNELDRATAGASTTSDRECVRDAVRAAMPQADAAVFRARTYASLK